MKKILWTVVALVLAWTSCASAQSLITASGSGQVQVAPDIAVINLGVSAMGEDVSETMDQVNVRLNNVRGALKDDGVQPEDIAVSDLYMYPQYDYNSIQETIRGYTVSHQVSVTVRDVEKLGELIDVAIAAGANELNGVSFESSKADEAYEQALAQAVGNARRHAQIMAQAEGLTLGELMELNEGGNTGHTAKALADSAGAASTQVDIGWMTVAAVVTAVFAAQ